MPGWLLVETGDGSPSLQWLDHERHELMHHSGGAFSETIYIYEPVVKAAFEKFESPTLVSVGLGLGYNEILVAKQGRPCQLVSFESDPYLRDCFHWFIHGKESPLSDLYRQICRFYEVDEDQIRHWFQDQGWHCERALISPQQIPARVHGFLWDAFSKKTSPSLWDENFLIQSLDRGVAGAALATYASNSVLKRSLRAAGYDLQIREGFQGKRNATYATRTASEDFYFENGLMVFTESYLQKRGYCCKSNCRHCPY